MNNHTDKELLMMAAKAAGIKGIYHEWWDDLTDGYSIGIAPKGACGRDWWNPLSDKRELLDMQIKLRINLIAHPNGAVFVIGYHLPEGEIFRYFEIKVKSNKDIPRAIVRAAADIGSKL